MSIELIPKRKLKTGDILSKSTVPTIIDQIRIVETATTSDLAVHVAASDPHTGYRLESADHTHQSTGAQAGTLDHGLALTGLTDDDHTQYIKHSLADAANDFLVASGADAFAKQTLAATKVILGLGQGARVNRSTAQTLTTAVVDYVSFDTEEWDTDTIWEGVTNPTRFTCKTIGKYLVIGEVSFVSNVTGRRILAISLNRTTTPGGCEVATNLLERHLMQVSTICNLAVNDYIELYVYQNSGGDLNLQAATSKFMMQKVG